MLKKNGDISREALELANKVLLGKKLKNQEKAFIYEALTGQRSPKTKRLGAPRKDLRNICLALDFIMGIYEEKRQSKEFRRELADLYEFSGGEDTLDSTFYKALNKGLDHLYRDTEAWLMLVEGDTDVKDMDDDFKETVKAAKLRLKYIEHHRKEYMHLRDKSKQKD